MWGLIPMVLFVFLPSFKLVQGTIHINKVIVPKDVVVGDTVKLTCDYSLKTRALYSVKWYKERHELYRYRPKNDPPNQIFELPGIRVNMEMSNERDLVLRDVTRGTSGSYRCEVSEEVTFLTVTDKGDLFVSDPPDGDPIINVFHGKYKMADEVRTNCTSLRAFPAPTIAWYINDIEADPDFIKIYPPAFVDDGLENLVVGLTFRVRKNHFVNRQIKLTCKVTQGNTYNKMATTILLQLEERGSEANMLESRDVSPSRNNSIHKVTLWLGVLSVCLGSFFLRILE